MLAIIHYTTRNKLLVATGADAKTMKRIRTLWTMGPIIYLGAILLSFLSTEASFAVYAATLAFYVLASSLGFGR